MSNDRDNPRRPGEPSRALAVVSGARPYPSEARQAIQAVPVAQADGWPPCALLLDNVLRLATNIHLTYEGPLAEEPFHLSAFAGREYMHFSGRTAEQAIRRLALAVRERLRSRQSGLVP